jgi:hypothetical protein
MTIHVSRSGAAHPSSLSKPRPTADALAHGAFRATASRNSMWCLLRAGAIEAVGAHRVSAAGWKRNRRWGGA